MWKGIIRFMLLVVGIIMIGAATWHFGQKVNSDHDGLPSAREAQNWVGLSQNDLGDSDGRGHSNLAENNDGTDPSSKSAVPSSLSMLQWEPVGPGGGGSQYSPAMAPNNPDLMYGICDMGGFYRSTDGGHNWRMVNGRDVNLVPSYGDAQCGPEFNPQDDNVALVARNLGMARTADAGLTWQKVSSVQSTAIAFHGLDGSHAFFAGDDQRLYESIDGGVTWTENPGWRSVGLTIRELFIDASSPSSNVTAYASTPSGIYKSVDGGDSWSPRNAGLSSDNILDMAGGMKSGHAILYCLLPTGLSGGALTGGVYRSTNGGDSWTQMTSGLAPSWNGNATQYTALGVCAANPDVAYVGCDQEYGPTIYKTSNGGDSWTLKLIDPGSPNKPPGMTVERDWITLHLSWGWGGAPYQVKVCATNPDVVAFSESGRTFRSDDGGESWFCCNNEETSLGSDWWKSVGFETTTVWGYFFDPFQANRHYIPYTDIGFARSEDAGESWRWSANGSPWRNTFYDLCFDPEVPGRMWAVASDNHDLPHHKMLRQDISQFIGGVLFSENYGATWADLGHSTGLPTGAVTSIILDPGSPTDRRTLGVTVLGRGVYKSADGGLTWTDRSSGLGMSNNMNAWKLVRLNDGTLYAAVTLAVDSSRNSHKGGLFRSTDDGDHWALVNANFSLNWIVGLSIDPRNGAVYVGCFDAPQIGGGGGFRSRDGGITWEKILDKTDVWKITPDPQNIQRLWACVQSGISEEDYEGEGLLLSEDNGKSWFHEPGFPFTAYGPQQVHFDPRDPQTVYVTTFGGGVWKAKVSTAGSIFKKRQDAISRWSELLQRNRDSITNRP
jgi:photosystem II stability/assembly factor-like uncharacterized protein